MGVWLRKGKVWQIGWVWCVGRVQHGHCMGEGGGQVGWGIMLVQICQERRLIYPGLGHWGKGKA